MGKSMYVSRQDADDAGVMWRKSSHSYPEGECVEVAQPSGAQVLFDDSKVRKGRVVEVSTAAAVAFVTAVRRGDI
ncbi:MULTISPECIES: DUF397 domain-containing protein [Streptomyces]|uniref:DUF397 domain-containing protein n=1 Tax=Streptomyces TaxID=1883 RepID=UPI001F34F3C1|nr:MULTISPECIES: DUF397 domain-containing protein [Streptomyces]WDO09778.1 DUF397 domain-containing protein [Streptomyces murinus]WSI84054.1 DUF397 domain-containing protein [Streptomyces murinus]WUD05769.1 DUF397 domain-containing protein [Streptomyces murinus]